MILKITFYPILSELYLGALLKLQANVSNRIVTAEQTYEYFLKCKVVSSNVNRRLKVQGR
jgi:hypothetical protein